MAAGCVPMQAKRPQTEKQRQAIACPGLLAKMKSERGRFAKVVMALNSI